MRSSVAVAGWPGRAAGILEQRKILIDFENLESKWANMAVAGTDQRMALALRGAPQLMYGLGSEKSYQHQVLIFRGSGELLMAR